jgi:hypothetical protein
MAVNDVNRHRHLGVGIQAGHRQMDRGLLAGLYL